MPHGLTVVIVGRTGSVTVRKDVSTVEFTRDGFVRVTAADGDRSVDLGKVGTVTAFWTNPDGMADRLLPAEKP